MRAIITTIPFGEIDPTPRQMLATAGIEFVVNPLGRKLRAAEVPEFIHGYDIVIAGTEKIGADALSSPALKVICRVGIGLDGVDLVEARERGISVTYTPDAPSPAVAELTIGLMMDLLRHIGRADRGLRAGKWDRFHGRRIANCTVGVIGYGRIGHRVVQHLGGFPGVQILVHDLLLEPGRLLAANVRSVSLEALLSEADVVTVHVPLSSSTHNLIGAPELTLMKRDAVLINTSRGGVVCETALFAALEKRRIGGAAIDVFTEEPYAGPLSSLENVILTCHMGSMTIDCRIRMEIEATQDALRFAAGEPLISPVPDAEYQIAMGAARPRRVIS